ncbi:MAG: YbbR-like domain-containing protein [Bacilli bacterium]
MEKKKKLIIGGIAVAIAAAGVGGFLYFNSDKDDKDDDNRKHYKNVEKKAEEAAEKWIKDDYYYGNYVLISELIENEVLKSKDLEVDGDKCDGYVAIERDSKKIKTNAYIKCSKYTTKEYDKEIMMGTEYKSLSYELKNEDKLKEPLSVKSVSLSSSSILIKANKNDLKKIDSVKALIDIKDLDIDEEGEYKTDELEIIAYDEDGKEIKDIEIDTTVTARVQVSSFSKSVKIEIVPKGKLVDGKAIGRVQIMGDNYVTIHGSKKALDEIETLQVEVDVEGLGNEDSKEYKVSLAKPEGVTSISETHCDVKISFEDIIQKEIKISDIKMKNLDSSLSASFKSEKDKEVVIVVTGAESVINGMGSYSIDAYVDLKDLKKGEHEVEVQIDNKDSRVNYTVNNKITIVITK